MNSVFGCCITRDTIDQWSVGVYDAMNAAIALANELPVYTCSPDDFAVIEGLDVRAIPVLE